VPYLASSDAWLDLLDRLRRQTLDVIAPVLALIAAGQITGIDWMSYAAIIAGGAIVTIAGFVAGTTGATWWERLVATAAGSALAVCGTDWAGWIHLDWPTAAAAIAASTLIALLRLGTTPATVRRVISSRIATTVR
jgi:hypothetical protein